MRTIERTTQFKRDYKRELKGPFKALLQSPAGDWFAILTALASDMSLPDKFRDHALGGQWKDGLPGLPCSARPFADLSEARPLDTATCPAWVA
ncbi:hypothetical protein C265_09351 [Cupriavidus sp. GA3-3]|nr:hypothetical protein C265_09351 [Cupriavidus sp. GA3-3]